MQAHTDIDLYLVDPNGLAVTKGFDETSVFERVSVANPRPVTWNIKSKGYTLTGRQRIYWVSELQGSIVIDPGDLPPLGGH